MKEGVVYNCRIIEDTKGVKTVGNRLKERKISRGSEIQLKAVNISEMPSGYLLGFQTKDGYYVNHLLVIILGEAPRANPIQSQMNGENAQYEEAKVVEEKEKKEETKNNFYFDRDKINKKSKATVNASLAGGALGLIYAVKYDKSKWTYAFIGVALGGFVATKLIK
jgi:hypothetical protein